MKVPPSIISTNTGEATIPKMARMVGSNHGKEFSELAIRSFPLRTKGERLRILPRLLSFSLSLALRLKRCCKEAIEMKCASVESLNGLLTSNLLGKTIKTTKSLLCHSPKLFVSSSSSYVCVSSHGKLDF